MNDTARPLRAVPDFDTGEVHVPVGAPSSYGEALQVIERQNAELNGYRLRVSRLERDLAAKQAADPDAGQVRTVLDWWADRATETGWWSRRPMFKPGDHRWRAVKNPLQDGREVDYLLVVVDGAFMQPRQQVKREWLEPKTIFGNMIETHFERAQDSDMERVRALRVLPKEIVEDPFLPDLCLPCDHCGHIELDHQKWSLALEQPCLVHGCHCTGYDDLHARCERWKAERERIAS
jgi:hypothetical protein